MEWLMEFYMISFSLFLLFMFSSLIKTKTYILVNKIEDKSNGILTINKKMKKSK